MTDDQIRIAELEERVAKLEACVRIDSRKCAKCDGAGTILGPSDCGYMDCPACDGKGF